MLMADPKEVLHKIRESQSLMAEPDPEELTLQLRFTVLHILGIVSIAAVACWVATTFNPPTKAATLGVAAALLVFGRVAGFCASITQLMSLALSLPE
jgi:hypothetical protein